VRKRCGYYLMGDFMKIDRGEWLLRSCQGVTRQRRPGGRTVGDRWLKETLSAQDIKKEL